MWLDYYCTQATSDLRSWVEFLRSYGHFLTSRDLFGMVRNSRFSPDSYVMKVLRRLNFVISSG